MQVILGPASKDLLKVQLQPLSDPGGLRSHVAANWTQEARDGFARHFFVDFFFPLSYVAFIHARARAEFQPGTNAEKGVKLLAIVGGLSDTLENIITCMILYQTNMRLEEAGDTELRLMSGAAVVKWLCLMPAALAIIPPVARAVLRSGTDVKS